MASPNVQIALKFFEFSRTGDWDALEPLLARDLQQLTSPASLGVPVRNRDEVVALLRNWKAFTKTGTVNVTPIEIIESADGRVILHAKAHDSFSPDGQMEYSNEYVFFFAFTEEDGVTKIVKLHEFVDSAFFKDYVAHVTQGQK